MENNKNSYSDGQMTYVMQLLANYRDLLEKMANDITELKAEVASLKQEKGVEVKELDNPNALPTNLIK